MRAMHCLFAGHNCPCKSWKKKKILKI